MIAQQQNPPQPTNKEQPHIRHSPFDTQISQQAHPQHEDKGFSPWVREKTIVHHEYSPQEIDYHRFLATIRLSPRHKGKFRKGPNNIEETDNLEMLKADLTSKIKAQKIGNCQFQDEKQKSRTIQSKSFFQRRANLMKLYRRPKSIDLSLEFDPKNILRCSPLSHSPQPFNSEQLGQNNKKDQKTIHKLKKKKIQLDEQKKFSLTMKDFRVNIMSAQKKVFQTLELSINETSQKSKRSDIQNEAMRTTFFNRPKFLKPRPERATIQLGDTLACLGKNALLNLGHKTCRQKVRDMKILNKAQVDQIFMS